MSAPNDTYLALLREVQYITTPQLPTPTSTSRALIDALALIQEAREAMDFTRSESQRFSRQRAWLIKTDPVVQPLPGGAP